MIAEPRLDEFNQPERVAQVRAELRDLYRDLDQAVAEFGPLCVLTGRCCRFQEYGHTLFLSEPEALLLLADAPPAARGLDAGESCPWQDSHGRCSARDARPLGCRVFFCDPSYETRAPELTETFLSRLKRLAEEHDWPWHYAPLHDHLRRARAEGRLDIELAPGCLGSGEAGGTGAGDFSTRGHSPAATKRLENPER
jgi:Fe-S-cluster containining protein